MGKELKNEEKDLLDKIKVTTYQEDQKNIIEMEFNYIIKSYQRNRSGRGGHMYDPLNTYKKYIRTLLKKELVNIKPTSNSINLEMNLEYPISSSYSERKILMILRDLIKITSKPDLDNTLKTSLDLFKNIIWIDDSQVTTIIANKKYSDEPKTIIKIVYDIEDELKLENITGRINIYDKITENEKKLIKLIKKGK